MNTPDLTKVAQKLTTDGPVKTLPTPRRVQLLFGGIYLLATIHATYVWEHPFYPQFYVPLAELEASARKSGGKWELREGEAIHAAASGGKRDVIATRYSIHAGGKSTDRVLAFPSSLTGPGASLAGLVKVDFAAIDQWFEEDTPIHVHPKDPFKRIDVLASSRRVRVSVGGHQIAETSWSMHLHETGLPARFYLPLSSYDASVLRPSQTRTQCPYKGEAEYYSVEVGGEVYADLLWYYTRPLVESSRVEGLVCPYNEKVDIELDGEKLERPVTLFGKMRSGEKPSALTVTGS